MLKRIVKEREGNMSFSADVREELSRHIPNQRHCAIAEVAAIITMGSDILFSVSNKVRVRVTTENIYVARKYYMLLKRTFDISANVSVRLNISNRKQRQYIVTIEEHNDSIRVLQAIKLIDNNMEICENMSLVSNIVIAQPCCKRAFLRGAFLSSGSMSDPNKSYHFEIVSKSEAKANQLKDMMATFGLDAKVVLRKQNFVTYIKDSEQIVDMLNVMEAHVALMNLENVRIVKEVRNNVNRKVNCEAANLTKTINASVKQIEDIELIKMKLGLDNLSDNLKEIALIRIDNPDATLKEIGDMLNPPLGKSGVNHRLKKLGEIADSLRE